MELLAYLKKNYQKGELIFLKDISILSKDNLRQQRKILSDKGFLIRYQRGVFLLPRKDKEYGSILPSFDTYLYSAYCCRRGHHFGYYDGKSQLALAGLLKNEEKEKTIYSNETAIRKSFPGHTILPCKTEITDWNYPTLCFLEILSVIENYEVPFSSAQSFLKDRIKKEGINKTDRSFYASYFPLSIYKAIFEYSLSSSLH